MTLLPSGALTATAQPPLQLVLAGCGRQQELAALMAGAAPCLARILGLDLRAIAADAPPGAALAALQTPADRQSSGWLAALSLDPGLPLPGSGSWAEALGAWRQPTLLLLQADALDTGRPAAATALLRQWRVPLLGLLQWGGPWNSRCRREDGLPWLGWLDDAPGDCTAATADADHAATGGCARLEGQLRPLLRRRLQLLDLG